MRRVDGGRRARRVWVEDEKQREVIYTDARAKDDCLQNASARDVVDSVSTASRDLFSGAHCPRNATQREYKVAHDRDYLSPFPHLCTSLRSPSTRPTGNWRPAFAERDWDLPEASPEAALPDLDLPLPFPDIVTIVGRVM